MHTHSENESIHPTSITNTLKIHFLEFILSYSLSKNGISHTSWKAHSQCSVNTRSQADHVVSKNFHHLYTRIRSIITTGIIRVYILLKLNEPLCIFNNCFKKIFKLGWLQKILIESSSRVHIMLLCQFSLLTDQQTTI